jgi:hypothetical protein
MGDFAGHIDQSSNIRFACGFNTGFVPNAPNE